MNRYPLWKYLSIALVIVMGLIYTLPNFYGEQPAVQISPSRTGQPLESSVAGKVEAALKQAGIEAKRIEVEKATIKVHFDKVETQIHARDVIKSAVGTNYMVGLNMLPASPSWFTALGAKPMTLGLDLRGGVHFLLQVDMQAAKNKAFDRYVNDIKRGLIDESIRFGSVKRVGDQIQVVLGDATAAEKAKKMIAGQNPALTFLPAPENTLLASLSAEELEKIEERALEQNRLTLHNRLNATGLTEPNIQVQKPDRIIVQLPGVQDPAQVKKTIGKTAGLEMRMVNDEGLNAALAGSVPDGTELLEEVTSEGLRPILVKKEVVLTGDNINDAKAGFDQQSGIPTVDLSLDSYGSGVFAQVTKENVGKRLALLLVEKDSKQVVTAPVIRQEIGGGRVQISGSMNVAEANETATLLRSGALAAPMEIIEERTIGPSLGADNIKRGINANLWGFALVALLMMVYYRVFGFISTIALAANLLVLLAILSVLEATLTLPGIAAIALTLGMAIDSNVLINERIREELRKGSSPHKAIHEGYAHAWSTIVDSNVTTLIAGIALLVFGTGPVQGFATVHCIGIVTSMFSAVVVSRAVVNLTHGGRKLTKLWV